MADARKTRLVIDLDCYRSNLKALKAHFPAQVKLCSVVKADAYGHGLVPFGLAAEQAGCDWLAVAIAEEGVALRQAGVKLPILILGGVNDKGALLAAQHQLTITVFDEASIAHAEQAGEQVGRILPVHLKLDTGMGRLGVRDEEAIKAALALLDESPFLQLTGAFTHFAAADAEDLSFLDKQLRRFKKLTETLPRKLLFHAAASASALRRPDTLFDMARIGIAAYGCMAVESPVPLKPCMTWVAEVTAVRDMPEGQPVGYGMTYQTTRPTRVAVLGVGYGDGYRRALSNKAQVLIDGKRCHVIGRVCMDMIMADVTDVPNVAPGDEAVLMGVQGTEEITAVELARLIDTIPYEIVLSPLPRVSRVYLGVTEPEDDKPQEG